MKTLTMKDYSDDDSTRTLRVITGVTERNCIVSEREYSYMEEGTLEMKVGLEITLEVPNMTIEKQVYRTLEDLRQETEGSI